MKLNAPNRLVVSLISGISYIFGRSNRAPSLGQGGDGVAVAHPYLRIGREALEEPVAMLYKGEVGTPLLTAAGGLHVAAVGVAHILRTVADAQYWQAAADLAEVHLEGLGVVDAVGRAAENHPNHRGVVVRELVVRQNFAERVHFSHTPADELRSLAAKVQDNNLLLHVGVLYFPLRSYNFFSNGKASNINMWKSSAEEIKDKAVILCQVMQIPKSFTKFAAKNCEQSYMVDKIKCQRNCN